MLACFPKKNNADLEKYNRTVGEEQLLFSLRKAGYPAGKLSDEFPDRKYSSVAAKWRKMYTPTDYEIVHEWKHAEDLQLEESQREGSPWSSIGQLFPSHGAGECLIRFLELQGSLPYPCPSNSATLWEPEDILVLVSMRNK